MCVRYFFYFFITFIDLRVGNIFLIESSLYRCACRKETASRELVVVMVKMREVGMLL